MTSLPAAPGAEQPVSRTAGWLLGRSPRVLGLGVALVYLCGFTLLLSGTFWLTVEGTRLRSEAALAELVTGIASQVDAAQHEALRDPAQSGTAPYMAALGPLARIHRSHPDIRNIYTLRPVPGGWVYVLDTAWDAQLRGRSTSLTRVGQPVADGAIEAGMPLAVLGGAVYIDKSVYAESGVTLQGIYAPIRDVGGQVVAILGVDYGHQDYVDIAWRWTLPLLARAVAALALLSALLGGAVFLLRDQLGQLLEERRLEGIRDGLTGLYNRRYFGARLARAVASSAAEGWPLTLMVFDADHFKRINDAHGHPAGDEVLVMIAARLGECLRAEDTAFRIGGEEFAVIMPHAGPGAAEAVFRRLNDVIRRPLAVAGAEIVVTVSGGIALLDAHTRSPEHLLSRADQALYIAKDGGRDSCVVAPPAVEAA